MVCPTNPPSYSIMGGYGKGFYGSVQACNRHSTIKVVLAKSENERMREFQGVCPKMEGYGVASATTHHRQRGHNDIHEYTS